MVTYLYHLKRQRKKLTRKLSRAMKRIYVLERRLANLSPQYSCLYHRHHKYRTSPAYTILPKWLFWEQSACFTCTAGIACRDLNTMINYPGCAAYQRRG